MSGRQSQRARRVRSARAYAGAAGAVALAALLTFPLQGVLGATSGRMPFALFFGAVFLAARFGGLRPGLASVALSAAVTNYFFIEPFSAFGLGFLNLVQLAVFVSVSSLIVFVTDRGRREHEAAVESREWLSTTLRSIGDAVVATDEEGRVSFMNPVAETLTGWTAAEARGLPLREVFRAVNERTREAVENPVERVLREGRTVGLANHTVLIARDGSERPIEDSAAPIMDASGRVSGVVLVFHDVTARRVSDEALRSRERELTDFVENATVGLHWVGADGTILWANRAELEMLGYSAEEYIGHNITEFHADPEVIEDILCRLTSREALDNYEARLRRKDGSIRHVIINSNVMWGERGEFVHTRCFTRDITDRVEAESALRESEQRYRALAEAMPQIVWTARPDGYYDYYNRRWVEYTGLGLEQARGWSWQPVIHPEDVEKCLRGWATAVETGEEYSIEYRMRRASDGQYRWHLGRAVPLRDSEGRILKWFGTSTDIHDQKVAQERARFLAEAGELLSSSLDYEATLERLARLSVSSLADHCIVDLIGGDGRARRVVAMHVDPAMEGVMGELREHPPDVESGVGIPRVLRTGRAEIVAASDAATLSGIARGPEHLELLRRLRLSSFMAVPLFARGRILGALTLGTTEGGREYDAHDLAFAEEIARRAALAIDNARLYRESRESNRLKDEFLATLSHELRTPLTPVIGWTHMIRSGQLSAAEAEQGLEVIDKNSQSLARLINDLLDMSSILSGKMSIERAPVALGEVVTAAVETVRPHAEARRVGLDVTLDGLSAAPGGAIVSGDRTRLGQVFWNLLTNAVKFSPAGSRVRVRCSALDGLARVEVEDSGSGIRPDFLPYVFERFRQADQSTTRAHGGLGIGLALVKSFVEAHGGTAEAASEGEGRGSRFTVTLPLIQSLKAEGAGPGGRGEAAQGAGGGPRPSQAERRVLVVEDAPDTLEMLRVALAASGYGTVLCASADEALRAARDVWFDIVVSDIGLPQVDGYELIRRLRELPHMRRTPAIALTGYASVTDAEAALEAGFDVHIPKPVDPTALADAIGRLLRRKALPEV